MTTRSPMIADLSRYLDNRGCIAVSGERAARLADFLTQLVARVTMAYGFSLPLGAIHCRHKRCRGYLQVLFNNGLILWHCNRCGDEGAITRWRHTLWDLLDDAPGEGEEIATPPAIH